MKQEPIPREKREREKYCEYQPNIHVRFLIREKRLLGTPSRNKEISRRAFKRTEEKIIGHCFKKHEILIATKMQRL